MPKRLDLINQKFGRLTVKSFSHISPTGHSYWNCICDCGIIKLILGNSLKTGHTQSCGCFAKDNPSKGNMKHGMWRTKTYKAWMSMKTRCTNNKYHLYHRYGGRGIKICKRWQNSFINFYKDMGNCPKGKTLDRINNNNSYKPSNCSWVTPKEQANNTTKNIHITIGKKTHNVTEWSIIYKIDRNRIYKRLKYGWDPEKAMLTPIHSISK